MTFLLGLQVSIAGLLLGVSVVALGMAARVSWGVWRDAGASRHDLLAMSGVLVAGIALRLALPVRLATIFIGYRNTAHAIALSEVHHYGFGSPILYNVVFRLFPADHVTLMHTNTVLGVLVIPFVATWALQVFRDRKIGLLVGLLLALLPIFVRNDTSDANNVPCILWLISGLVLWHEASSRGRTLLLFPALPLLALAAVGRPELPLLIPPFLALSAWAGVEDRLRCGLRPLVAIGAAWLLLVLPHMLHILWCAIWLNEADSLPGVSLGELLTPASLFSGRTILFRWDLLPVAIPALVVASLVFPGATGRRREAAISLMALLYIIPTLADADYANIARIHVPTALLLLLPAAAVIIRAGDRPGKRWVSWVLVAGIALSAVPTGMTLYAPTNGDHEEALFSEARTHLPEESHTLVVRWNGDQSKDVSKDFTHLHIPAYWFRPPRGQSILRSIHDWEVNPDLNLPAYFLRSVRCYANFRHSGAPQASGENLSDSCRRMLTGYRLRPVFEWEVPNRGNLWINYYGDLDTFTLGLYEILGPAKAP